MPFCMMDYGKEVSAEMNGENLKVYKPHGLLQSYVRYYWIYRAGWLPERLTFPIGCPQIIFHRKTPLSVWELGIRQSELTVSGQVNFPACLWSEEEVEMIVVVFQPYAMGLFLDIPMSLLYNQEISGYDLESVRLNELAAHVFGRMRDDDCISLIERWLLAQLVNLRSGRDVLNVRRMHAVLGEMFKKTHVTVGELSSSACLGKKQLERVFNCVVGMNPKEYMKIVRFQKALRFMQVGFGDMNWAQLSYCCGYADQSHFIREFKKYSGLTPAAMLKGGQPYSDLFTNPT